MRVMWNWRGQRVSLDRPRQPKPSRLLKEFTIHIRCCNSNHLVREVFFRQPYEAMRLHLPFQHLAAIGRLSVAHRWLQASLFIQPCPLSFHGFAFLAATSILSSIDKGSKSWVHTRSRNVLFFLRLKTSWRFLFT